MTDTTPVPGADPSAGLNPVRVAERGGDGARREPLAGKRTTGGREAIQAGAAGRAVAQAIRRGTFTSVNELIHRIRTYVEHWNTDAKPFAWTATADEILAKVRWVQTNVKQLVANNSK